jgi:hypothetical protein
MGLTVVQVVDKLGLSFKNSVELDKIIDSKLPGRPAFQRHTLELGGEMFDVYFRDIMLCIRALYSDPAFAPYMVYAPERHFVDETEEVGMFHDMHTGRWWWSAQVQYSCFEHLLPCSDLLTRRPLIVMLDQGVPSFQ